MRSVVDANWQRIHKVVLLYAGLVALLVLAIHIIKPFLEPLAWATVLVISTWPLYERLRASIHRPALAAFLMTLMLGVLALAIILPLGFIITKRFSDLETLIASWLGSEKIYLYSTIDRIPYVGTEIRERIEQLQREGASLTAWLGDYHRQILGVAASAATGALRNFFVVVVSLICAFFMYMYGQSLAGQIRTVGRKLLGLRYDRVAGRLKASVQGTVFGTAATALAQSLLAGLAFWAVGAPNPLALTALTFIFALLAFGAVLVYVPVVIYLIYYEAPWWHVALFITWCVGLVSSIDNILRAYFISQANRSPMLFVFMGVVGGFLYFGLIGIFIGPIILVLLEIAWREVVEV